MATAAQAAQLGGGSAPNISIIRILAALVLCAFAALAVILLIRMRSGTPIRFSLKQWPKLGGIASPRIRVLESRRMSAHADLCLVRCGGQDYLIACGASGIVVVDQSDSVDDVDVADNEPNLR